MLTPRQAFKVAFINQCLQQGQTLDEVKSAAEKAREKLAVDGLFSAFTKPVGAAGSTVAKGLLNTTLLGLLAAPPIAGAAVGWAGAKGTDADEHDAEAQKQQELIDEYARLAAQARRHRAVKQYQGRRQETNRLFV